MIALPYQAVMQPVRILSMVPVEDAEYPGVHVELPQPAEQLPHNVQGLFTRRENIHMLRGNCIFFKPPIRTNSKRHCITTEGVHLWNNCNNELK